MSIRGGSRSVRLVLAVVACLGASGCLENLNQQKYFQLMQAGAPEQWERVTRNRDSVDEQLREALTANLQRPATRVALWGESWDVVRGVTDGEVLFMRGRIFHEVGPATPYYVAFAVDEFGRIGVESIQVMEPTR